MQSGHDEVAGLRCRDRRADRLHVTHLTDHDHVGILTHGRPHRHGEAPGIHVDLALIDHRDLVLVHHLDGVLDGDDMYFAMGVDVIDHGGQGRGLARTGGAGDQHQAPRLQREGCHDLRQ